MTSIFYISLGLLCGTLLNVKQVGGLCGALLTNLSAWLSGVWFDLSLLGGTFESVANFLPFVHFVDVLRLVFAGDFLSIGIHLLPIIIYVVVTSIFAVLFFLKQMKKQ